MTMFWLKTQAAWRETSRTEHTGAVGTYDLSKVSDADLNRLEAILGPLTDGRGLYRSARMAGGRSFYRESPASFFYRVRKPPDRVSAEFNPALVRHLGPDKYRSQS